jgi:glycogen synthase
VQRALNQFQKKSSKWKTMRKAAAAARFEWAASIDAYIKQLYQKS